MGIFLIRRFRLLLFSFISVFIAWFFLCVFSSFLNIFFSSVYRFSLPFWFTLNVIPFLSLSFLRLLSLSFFVYFFPMSMPFLSPFIFSLLYLISITKSSVSRFAAQQISFALCGFSRVRTQPLSAFVTSFPRHAHNTNAFAKACCVGTPSK